MSILVHTKQQYSIAAKYIKQNYQNVWSTYKYNYSDIYTYISRISNEKMINKDIGELYNQNFKFTYKLKTLITQKA